MRFGLRSKSVEKVEDVKTGLIKSRRIIFTPSVDLKDELAATSIMITCYDRTGKEVKRVTSTSGEVEDPEENDNENENGGSGSENSGSGSQNSGSGSSTGSETGGNGSQQSGSESVTAPEISGQTQFTDSTQVTIQGPQGAEIRYTTDGSAPSAESTLYSEAITLNSTTTIKAIAILDGETSEVASKTFTKTGESGGFDLGN
ncbi:MAG: chitobiase/beta-hexosaminidase C-terminal domain-containing protein, partial [Prevotella sp.]|nr:chitobiase/beta-hexosaminidase C-terminal domain-containing protein [Prevotella sp.]